MSGLNGLDILLLIIFFYISFKLYMRAKKENDNE